jgi:hypothetical protein
VLDARFDLGEEGLGGDGGCRGDDLTAGEADSGGMRGEEGQREHTVT